MDNGWNIEARDNHLSTGFIGTKDLMLALAKIGRNPDTSLGAGDVACRLIHNDTFPSWRLSPSNTAPPASGSDGTAGRPRPASAIPA
ncbi:MAG: hypothetical protein HZC54_12940 [Verrucomicrobia bacterium]|nr:hypothetical protein [Verrucomicrobiota bacterium]